ncbi:DUF5336 domain-containing protein [Mycobacterium sp.]|jgi:hypothetical protein|uniref:DUF5336 domain-containing protein n=1 Tax=Mycobacterium sp. TaxID=1785 RepID=UPI003F9572E4
MTYSPGSPGYPPAQSPGGYGASSTPSFTKSDDGESNLKVYLAIGVLVLGLASYLLSYGPMITRILPNGDELVESGSTLPIDLGLLAALLAGVSVLPKAKNYAAVVAAVAVLGALLLVEDTIGASGRGWALWFALGCGVVQAVLAVTALLLDAGVITPPAPRPKYDQYYGQYGGYYGQQSPYQQQSPQQSGYGAQYGGYPSGPSTGGFSAVGPQSGPIPAPQSGPQHGQQQGSPTPPTGFPSFSPPPSSGSGGPGQGNSANHAGSGQGQHSYGQGQQPQAPSSPSGPSQS